MLSVKKPCLSGRLHSVPMHRSINVRTAVSAPKVEQAVLPDDGLRRLSDLPVENGLPVLGFLVEQLRETLDMEDLFDRNSCDSMVANLGPVFGRVFATRNRSEIDQVLTASAAAVSTNWPESFALQIMPQKRSRSHEEALKRRRALSNVMSRDTVLRLQLSTIVRDYQDAIHRFANGGKEVLWHKEAAFLAFTVACRSAVGDLITEQDIKYLFPYALDNHRAIYSLNFGRPEGLPFTPFRKGIDGRKEIFRVFRSRIHERLQNRDSMNTESIISKLALSLESNGIDISQSEYVADDLANEVIMLLFAGTHTASHTLASIVQWLSLHPEWLDALWIEQQHIMADCGPEIDARVLCKCSVATAFILEVFRLTPAIHRVFRVTLQDTVIGNTLVPKGTNIFLAMKQALKRTGNGTSTFDPDHWLSDDRTTLKSTKEIRTLVFGAGARKCTGQNLAMVEMVAALAIFSREVKRVDMSEEEQRRKFHYLHPTGMPSSFTARTD